MYPRFFTLLLILMSVFLLPAGISAQADAPTERITHYGTVTGLNNESSDGTYAWLGIPFAQPPVGERRWMAPVAPDSWSEPLSATAFGQACLQNGSIFGPGANNRYDETIGTTLNTPVGSEDCLYLNIWRPATDEDNLPVVFFIHGGSGVVGYTADPVYNGANLASAANAVVVTASYRLGLFGLFNLAQLQSGASALDASGNFALLDTIQALTFIQENIAAFGGNPGNVTIMGQSAGGVLTWALITSPLAAGLFDKAIPISAGISMAEDNTQTMVSSMADSRETAEVLLYTLLVNDGTAADAEAAADYVATQTDAQIAAYLRAQDATTLLAAWPTTKQASGVIPEGTVLPPHPLGAIRSGNYNHVPILAGYTANESKLLLGLSGVENGFILFDHAELFSMFAAYNPDSPTLTEADVIHESHLPPNTLFTGWNSVAALANISFTDPVRDTTMNAMREQQANLWAYQFSWAQEPTPWNTVFGAAHGFDLPFVFGNFGPSLFANIAFSAANAPGRLALSEKMIHTIAVFIRTGDPNNPELSVTWSAWPAQLIFDATPTTVDIRLKE